MIPIKVWTRAEMMKRVAFFKDLKGCDDGLPDSKIPECARRLINVIGFNPPPSDDSATFSPVGKDASAQAAIQIQEGFNLGFAVAKPGCGPLMHNHDTNETFMPITGRWRCAWNEGPAQEHVDLGPLDVISFPAGVARRFQNVTEGEPDAEHILLFVIGGNAPGAAFTEEAQRYIDDWRRRTGQAAE
jgi:mannose-6-phosphate isomerase-like protein (cupin superfamily)